MKKIKSPLSEDAVGFLKAGEEVLVSGVIYTARDQAHRRLVSLIRKGKELPFNLKDQVI
ncbi:MAG: TRZ/ATZ family protein, partial [Candidatus Omnitrophica bacterium]|nr:TRZ/ATZ family protein [Candidatus Omnitrophota bacterium]MBD3268615.1 TRZ/ATZ family protein [Candidatus Omnitrophota bacterium]